MRKTFLAVSLERTTGWACLILARYLIIFLLINFYIFRPSILRQITFKSSNLLNIIFCLIRSGDFRDNNSRIFDFFLSQKSEVTKREIQ